MNGRYVTGPVSRVSQCSIPITISLGKCPHPLAKTKCWGNFCYSTALLPTRPENVWVLRETSHYAVLSFIAFLTQYSTFGIQCDW